KMDERIAAKAIAEAKAAAEAKAKAEAEARAAAEAAATAAQAAPPPAAEPGAAEPAAAGAAAAEPAEAETTGAVGEENGAGAEVAGTEEGDAEKGDTDRTIGQRSRAEVHAQRARRYHLPGGGEPPVHQCPGRAGGGLYRHRRLAPGGGVRRELPGQGTAGRRGGPAPDPELYGP